MLFLVSNNIDRLEFLGFRQGCRSVTHTNAFRNNNLIIIIEEADRNTNIQVFWDIGK